jgi:hypothetical protein
VPKSLEAEFAGPQTHDERTIKGLIEAFNAAQTTKLEQELFKQRKRLWKAAPLTTRSARASVGDFPHENAAHFGLVCSAHRSRRRIGSWGRAVTTPAVADPTAR